MPKFTIKVNRIGYASKDFIIEADTEEQAEDIAIDEAGGESFSEHSSDYEIEGENLDHTRELISALKSVIEDHKLSYPGSFSQTVEDAEKLLERIEK
jgi:hypothetical protein